MNINVNILIGKIFFICILTLDLVSCAPWRDGPTEKSFTPSKDIIILSGFFWSHQGSGLASLQTKYRFGQLCGCLPVLRSIIVC